MISTLVDLLGNFYASNDFTNVEAIARSIHATVPGDQLSLQFLGLVYYRTGRIKDAVHLFDKVLPKKKPASGVPAQMTEDSPAAGDSASTAFYQEATRQNPKLARVWYDLGTTLSALRKFELALPAFRNALIARPDFSEAERAAGNTALRMGDLEGAEAAFSRLRAQQPNNAEAYRGLAEVYRKRRDFATAHACLVRLRLLRGGAAGIDTLAKRRATA